MPRSFWKTAPDSARVGKTLLAAGAGLTAVTGLYLFLPARDIMNAVTGTVVLLHLGLGLLATIAAGPALFLFFRRFVSRRAAAGDADSPPRDRMPAAPRFSLRYLSLLCVFSLCAVTGVYLAVHALFASAAHDTVILGAHITAGLAALLAGLLWWRHSRIPAPGTAQGPPEISAPGKLRAGSDRAAGSVTAHSSPGLPGLFAPESGALRLRTATRRTDFSRGFAFCLGFSSLALIGWSAALPLYHPETYYRDLTATNAQQAQNALFPAGIRAQAIDGQPAPRPWQWQPPSSISCGRAGCHPAAYHEWFGSAHHRAGSDIFYQSVAEQTAVKHGREAVRWCEGCHAPHAVLHGSGPEVSAGVIRKDEAEGVSCYSCHAATGTPSRTGGGRITLAEPQDYPFGDEPAGWQRNVHDYLLRVRPGPHQRAFQSPDLHRSAEFCSGCHRQSITLAQNHAQFVRGPDEYGEWNQSAFSGRIAEASVTAAHSRTCQDCHFKGAGGHIVHNGPGGNTALPAFLKDNTWLARNAAYVQNSVRLDIFALHRLAGDQTHEETIAPLDSPRQDFAVHPGQTWTLDILAQNTGAGHSFPAGYLDIEEAWIEVTVRDPRGRLLLSSGAIPQAAALLPPDTHAYRSLILDRTGKPLWRHETTEQAATVHRRQIPPEGVDIARYRVTIPPGGANGRPLEGPLHIQAILHYRAMRPDFAVTASASASRTNAQGAFVPPITTVASASVELPLGPAALQKAAGTVDNRTAAERFVRYGMGLMSPSEKPDVSRARTAFEAAASLDPGSPAPLLGLGGLYLLESDLRLASAWFERALKISPGLPAALAGLGTVANRQGQPEKAIELLTPLSARFPADRSLQFALGLALFKAGRYEPASRSFENALAADPDDYASHFQLKRCYEVLRKVSEARREDSITRYLASEPLAPNLVPAYLASHPESRAEAQALPEHTLRIVR